MVKVKKTSYPKSPSPSPDKETLSKEKLERVSLGKEAEIPPKLRELWQEKERLSEERIKELREKIERIDLEDALKIKAAREANKIKSLPDQKMIEKLMDIAKRKGVVYAVEVAKKMNSDYILDTFHDMLAENGFYENFLK